MPAFHVERSILINAPVDKVFDTASDFSTWTAWSPWLGAEKEAKVVVSDNPNSIGSNYHWTGEVVGEGIMEHISLERPTKIEDQITFLKPWKSTSDVGFRLEPSGDQTKISWYMAGSLPWFMFWMKGMMETYIRMDYERGLKLMKEYIETGEVLSDTQVNPPVDLDSNSPTKTKLVIGVRDKAPIKEIGPKMKAALCTTMEKLSAAGVSTDGDVLSVYHPFDIKSGIFDFTSGITVPEETSVPAELTSCTLASGKALHIRHTGSYENLGNSWNAGHQVARYRKHKLKRKESCFEIYRNDPQETDPRDLITDIYLPMK